MITRAFFGLAAVVLAGAFVLSALHHHWESAGLMLLFLAGLPMLYRAATYDPPNNS